VNQPANRLPARAEKISGRDGKKTSSERRGYLGGWLRKNNIFRRYCFKRD